MRRRAKARRRVLLSAFSSRLGPETLNIRIYRQGEALVCEREIVERDGTSFTMVLPAREPEQVRALLAADPYYPRLRPQVGRAMAALTRVLGAQHGDRAV